MTIVVFIPIIFAVLGLLIFLMASRADVKEIGKIMFFCGLLVTMFVFATNKVSL